ncbi:mCG141837, partial [Mus musculus]
LQDPAPSSQGQELEIRSRVEPGGLHASWMTWVFPFSPLDKERGNSHSQGESAALCCPAPRSASSSLCSLRAFARASPLCRTFPEQPPSFSVTASLRHFQVTFPGPVQQHCLSLPQVTPKPRHREHGQVVSLSG